MAALLDQRQAAPRTVYDLTVSGLHTFYAVAGSSPVLVHNCNNLVADAGEFPGQAGTPAQQPGWALTPLGPSPVRCFRSATGCRPALRCGRCAAGRSSARRCRAAPG
ncbi:hypothetical protein [Streptomyces sp. NPDC048665]|uniref:hypothetical protein n=1 Tax=Streptomyces sp. NPDC048665 TaxID=3155490 RepID=UPI00344320B5